MRQFGLLYYFKWSFDNEKIIIVMLCYITLTFSALASDKKEKRVPVKTTSVALTLDNGQEEMVSSLTLVGVLCRKLTTSIVQFSLIKLSSHWHDDGSTTVKLCGVHFPIFTPCNFAVRNRGKLL